MSKKIPVYPHGKKCKTCGTTEKYLSGRCRQCGLTRGRAMYGTPEYRAKDRARDATPGRKKQRKERASTEQAREAYSIYYRRYKYGLSPEQQQRLLLSQDGLCAICGEVLEKGRATHLDHDHVFNVARAFLCHGCNVALGMMHDSPARLRGAADYIEYHRRKNVIDALMHAGAELTAREDAREEARREQEDRDDQAYQDWLDGGYWLDEEAA